MKAKIKTHTFYTDWKGETYKYNYKMRIDNLVKRGAVKAYYIDVDFYEPDSGYFNKVDIPEIHYATMAYNEKLFADTYAESVIEIYYKHLIDNEYVKSHTRKNIHEDIDNFLKFSWIDFTSGEAFKLTCKKLNIEPNIKTIEQFLKNTTT
jgi:hypothetical protein